ncbi:MAG: DUF4917 family protein [Candidatus Aminicenantes bacterium]|nr:DUF4917 family protein [Candidatus Aminicenantes bacterium]
MPNSKPPNWNDIAGEFRGAGLILGNGASIAFDEERFSYSSILTEARNLRRITPDLYRVFQSMNTTDFERVLQGLWQANYVNSVLGVRNQRLIEVYRGVQRALIETVRHIHGNVPHNSIAERLNKAADFLLQFKTVLSLNYDVLVYWAMMKGIDRLQNNFADCFVNQLFQYDWENFHNQYNTLVFYPHGNLIIGRDINGVESKIYAENISNLIDTIIQKWTNEELAPVFVSEGTSEQKKITINRSPYLSTVFNEVIPKIGEKVVIYGWALSEQDNHIIKVIKNGSIRKFAISAHGASNRYEENCARIRRELNGFEVVFFNTESEGCWIYQESN